MCGIAGIVPLRAGNAPDQAVLGQMCQTIVHRGPDDESVDILDGVALGMRRLSIIDIAGGHQPLYNETCTVRTVFNGEIYNFRELRELLRARGHRFSTATDGEVIVHLWEDEGPEFASFLNGMFAIAVHDSTRRTVTLVRDRLGIKPLFYALTPDFLVFGSEVKTILASGLVSREIDLDALGQFMSWEYVPSPATLFRGIRKLDPGCMLTIDLRSSAPQSRRWWDVPPSIDDGDPDRDRDWEDLVDNKIGECVRRQLVSDVPLGAFLSGGVDSSLVVSGMGAARTFSIGFEDPSYNEAIWAGRVADHLGVTHRVETIRPDAVALFHQLMQYMDDPIGDFSIFPTFLVSRVAREEVTVALSGDGGDELFGGYETYVAQQLARAWTRLPWLLRKGVAEPFIHKLRPRPAKKGPINKAKRFVEGLDHDASLEHARWRVFVGDRVRSELFVRDARAEMHSPVSKHVVELLERAGDRSELDRRLYADVNSYLVDNCLVKVDRMSMACSLEVRVPLLDHELVELAFRVPSHLKVAGRSTKVLLKRIAARHVPPECVYRPKEGFSIPIKNWLNQELKPLVDDLLDGDALRRQGIFDASTVDRLKMEHAAGLANHSHILWALMVFEDWYCRWAS